MNTVNIKKKKISEYQIEDIKGLFADVLKKISEDDSIDTEFYNLVQQTNISVDRIEEVFEIN